MLVSRLLFLMAFGSGSGYLGQQNQAFGKGCIAKINFHRSWTSNDSMAHFILGVLGTNFHGFCCLGDWLEIG